MSVAVLRSLARKPDTHSHSHAACECLACKTIAIHYIYQNSVQQTSSDHSTSCGRKWNIIGREIKLHTIAMLPTRAIHSNTLATELRMDASVSTLVEDLESEAFTGSPEGCVFEMSESSMIVTGGCVKDTPL